MVVGGDFSATGLARPVCIEVAENPVSGRFVAKRKGRFSSVVRILRPTIAVDRPLVPGHVALPVLLFPLSLVSIRRVVAWSILVVLALRRITPLASLHIGLP